MVSDVGFVQTSLYIPIVTYQFARQFMTLHMTNLQQKYLYFNIKRNLYLNHGNFLMWKQLELRTRCKNSKHGTYVTQTLQFQHSLSHTQSPSLYHTHNIFNTCTKRLSWHHHIQVTNHNLQSNQNTACNASTLHLLTSKNCSLAQAL